MSTTKRTWVIPADIHNARLDQMCEIMAKIKDDVTDQIGLSTMNAVTISEATRAGHGPAARKVFAVWFLPGTTNDGHDTLINHGIDFELDAPTLTIKTWGTGYTADARLRIPHHDGATEAEIIAFWLTVDATARAIMHPALRERQP
jgi:hypothetical protein